MSEQHNLSPQEIKLLKDLIDSSTRIVAFTGAGISSESGIPTYRGHGGVWTEYDPDKYASIDYFRVDPGYFWSFFRDVRLSAVKNATPNQAHLSLAKLEQQGRLVSVITQNIDGLHQRAGSQKVRELHGNTTRFYCIQCHKKFTFSEVEQLLPKAHVPLCYQCGGALRPDVVLFGEMLPDDVFDISFKEAVSSDLMLVIGSSLVVYPAADIPFRALQHGAKLAIVNMDATPLDGMADLVIHARAGAALAEAVG